MPARGEGDQGVILELSALVHFPSFAITHFTDELAGVPPVSHCRLPNDPRQAEQLVDPSPR